ncbi:hypothetical protein JQX13_07405 [Archangium violaceum]|uniref:hypothetical protein n=1 Tax=Archangium violaceum TaxID=83451 RepID=UPI00193BDCE6|nr:hypothetical protein [Archangium violaceum]QRK09921.1 hypothetical protein JQX13_07405 [Archangium violaceum]
MSARASRDRLSLPLLVSVLLHLLLGVWLWLEVEPVPPAPALTRAEPEPLSVELEFIEARPSVAEVPKPPPAKGPKRTRPATRAERPRAAPVKEPSDPPLAGTAEADVPRAPVLVPSWMTAPPSEGSVAVGPAESRGRTLRPGDPELRPESPEEESERLTARVQNWLDDDMAEGRARGIGGHPYLEEARDSLEGALARADGGTPAQLGIHNPLAGLLKNYTEAAEEYGRTGGPGYSPPSRTPLHSEKLNSLFRDDPEAVLRMIGPAQARETLEALESRGALLTVKLELRHSRSGSLLGARLEQGSGNRLFDAFVLKVVPASLGELKPPPPEVIRDEEELRTRWLVEGWHHPPGRLTKAIASSMTSGLLMIPLDLLLEPKLLEQSTFEYRARLIGVY